MRIFIILVLLFSLAAPALAAETKVYDKYGRLRVRIQEDGTGRRKISDKYYRPMYQVPASGTERSWSPRHRLSPPAPAGKGGK